MILEDILEQVRAEITLAPIDGEVTPVLDRESPINSPLVASDPYFGRREPNEYIKAWNSGTRNALVKLGDEWHFLKGVDPFGNICLKVEVAVAGFSKVFYTMHSTFACPTVHEKEFIKFREYSKDRIEVVKYRESLSNDALHNASPYGVLSEEEAHKEARIQKLFADIYSQNKMLSPRLPIAITAFEDFEFEGGSVCSMIYQLPLSKGSDLRLGELLFWLYYNQLNRTPFYDEIREELKEFSITLYRLFGVANGMLVATDNIPEESSFHPNNYVLFYVGPHKICMTKIDHISVGHEDKEKIKSQLRYPEDTYIRHAISSPSSVPKEELWQEYRKGYEQGLKLNIPPDWLIDESLLVELYDLAQEREKALAKKESGLRSLIGRLF